MSCLILALPPKAVVPFPQLSALVSFFIWLGVFQPDGFPDRGCFPASQTAPLAHGWGQGRGRNERPLGLGRGRAASFELGVTFSYTFQIMNMYFRILLNWGMHAMHQIPQEFQLHMFIKVFVFLFTIIYWTVIKCFLVMIIA